MEVSDNGLLRIGNCTLTEVNDTATQQRLSKGSLKGVQILMLESECLHGHVSYVLGSKTDDVYRGTGGTVIVVAYQFDTLPDDQEPTHLLELLLQQHTQRTSVLFMDEAENNFF